MEQLNGHDSDEDSQIDDDVVSQSESLGEFPPPEPIAVKKTGPELQVNGHEGGNASKVTKAGNEAEGRSELKKRRGRPASKKSADASAKE